MFKFLNEFLKIGSERMDIYKFIEIFNIMFDNTTTFIIMINSSGEYLYYIENEINMAHTDFKYNIDDDETLFINFDNTQITTPHHKQVSIDSNTQITVATVGDVNSNKMDVLFEILTPYMYILDSPQIEKRYYDVIELINNEMKTSLNGIVSTIQVINEMKTVGNDILSILNECCYDLLQKIIDISDYVKCASGHFECVNTQFDIQEVIDKIDAVFRDRFISNNVTFNYKIISEMTKINNDSNKITKIMCNLISNSIKFSRVKNTVLDIKIYIEHENVHVFVTDTGRGVDPRYIDKIFHPFFKIDNDTAGMGLGLTLSREIAKKIGGDLTVNSNSPGRFTINFWFPHNNVHSNKKIHIKNTKIVLFSGNDNFTQELSSVFLKYKCDLKCCDDFKQFSNSISVETEFIILHDTVFSMIECEDYKKLEHVILNNKIPVISTREITFSFSCPITFVYKDISIILSIVSNIVNNVNTYIEKYASVCIYTPLIYRYNELSILLTKLGIKNIVFYNPNNPPTSNIQHFYVIIFDGIYNTSFDVFDTIGQKNLVIWGNENTYKRCKVPNKYILKNNCSIDDLQILFDTIKSQTPSMRLRRSGSSLINLNS